MNWHQQNALRISHRFRHYKAHVHGPDWIWRGRALCGRKSPVVTVDAEHAHKEHNNTCKQCLAALKESTPMTDTTSQPTMDELYACGKAIILASTLRAFANAFGTGTRTSTGETFYKLKDDAPAWIKGESGYDAMHAIHCAVDGVESPRLPDDWIYQATAHVADDLADRAEYMDDVDELRDAIHEIVDSQVDIYNGDLAAWLASSLYNASLVDEACAEYGDLGPTFTVGDRIARGQYLALERIAYAILELCEARVGELDNA